jgi:hypothetical protein
VAVETIPQRDALRLQLATIAGNEPASSFFEIRPLTIEGRPSPRDRAFVPVRDFEAAGDRIRSLAPRLNVFVGAAPRTREEGTADAVGRVWCLWADLDGRSALERLRDFRPLPSIVIRSGSPDCAHAWWPLRSPVTPQGAQRANRRLALALEADRATCDAARILRPAGSLNHKSTPPKEVTCTRCETDVFALADVVGLLADDVRYIRAPAPVGHGIQGDPHTVLAGLVRVVRDAPEGNRNRALFWSACRVAERSDAGDLHEDQALEEIRRAGLDIGLPEHEIDATIRSALARRPAMSAAA